MFKLASSNKKVNTVEITRYNCMTVDIAYKWHTIASVNVTTNYKYMCTGRLNSSDFFSLNIRFKPDMSTNDLVV